MAEKENNLTWRLADEGMDLLERAGLAGLYMSLRAAFDAGVDLSPLHWDQTDLTPQAVTVRWTGPARPAFARLMSWAWQVADAVLYLPAVHSEREHSQWWLRVPTHNGIMRTFLQHTNVQPKGEPITRIVRLDENREISVSFQPAIIRVPKAAKAEPPAADSSKRLLKPHKDVEDLFDRKGEFRERDVELSNWVYPGIAGRYESERAWVGEPQRALLLMLAPVSCLFQRLLGTGGNWVLVVPDVRDLEEFDVTRQRMNLGAEFTDIGSTGDAGLQFLAEYSTRSPRKSLGSGCRVMAMGKVGYYASQSIRKSVLDVPPELTSIQRYRLVHQILPNMYIPPRTVEEQAAQPAADGGPGRKTAVKRKQKAIQADARPRAGFIKIPSGRGRIADNLLTGRAWYEELAIPTAWDMAELEYQRKRLGLSIEEIQFKNICYQRSKLMRLIKEDDMWDSEAERVFIEVCWETLDSLYAQEVAAMSRGGSRTLEDRFEDLGKDIRRRLMQAKTRALLRGVLADLFCKAGRQKTIRLHPAAIWRLVDDPRQWQKGRDLALLALASHRKKEHRQGSEAGSNTKENES